MLNSPYRAPIARNKCGLSTPACKDYRSLCSHPYNKKKLDQLTIKDLVLFCFFFCTYQKPEVAEVNATPKSGDRDASRKTAVTVYLEQMLLEP